MKIDRMTTCLLTAAACAVWGVVAWKLLARTPRSEPPVVATIAQSETPASDPDTLRLNYPDPFLKGAAGVAPILRPIARSRPAPQLQREKVRLSHLGTIRSGGRELHFLAVDGKLYEFTHGGTVCGFVLVRVDRDSLYLRKGGATYGVKRCRP